MTNTAAWQEFLSAPVSGDAKALALHLAIFPWKPEDGPLNVRVFGESLKMKPYEYERAFNELRDPRVGWLVDLHLDRPRLRPDSLPMRLFSSAASEASSTPTTSAASSSAAPSIIIPPNITSAKKNRSA